MVVPGSEAVTVSELIRTDYKDYGIHYKDNVDDNIILIVFPQYVEIFYADENYALFYEKEDSIIKTKEILNKFLKK